MSENKRLLVNTGLIAIGNFGAKMISFLLLPLYTSILSTVEYGQYDYVVAISAFLLPIITLSMHESMFRFVIDSGTEGREYKKIISNTVIIILLGIVISFLGLFIIGKLISFNDWIYVWLYVSATALYTFSNNLLRGSGRMKEYAVISSCKNIVQLICNILCIAVLYLGFEGLLISLCVSELLAFIIVSVRVKLNKQIEVKLISVKLIKTMLKYSLPLIPNSLSAQVINLSDRLVITSVLGTSANGIYTVSYKFPNIVETVYHFFYVAWSESASRVFNDGKEKAIQYYQNLFKVLDEFLFSGILIMISIMSIMFRLLIRGDYLEGFVYIPILMFGMYFDSIGKFFTGVFTALKRTRVIATTTMIAAVINIILNVIFIPKYGLYAAAFSSMFAHFVNVTIRWIYLYNEIPIGITFRSVLLKIILVVLVMSLYSYDNVIKIVLSILIASVFGIVTNRRMIMTAIRKVRK